MRRAWAFYHRKHRIPPMIPFFARLHGMDGASGFNPAPFHSYHHLGETWYILGEWNGTAGCWTDSALKAATVQLLLCLLTLMDMACLLETL